PVIGKSINDLVGLTIGDALDLYGAFQSYFDSHLEGGVNFGERADLAGAIDWVVDYMIAHLQEQLQGDTQEGPFQMSGGFDAATHEIRFDVALDLRHTEDLSFDIQDLLPDVDFIDLTGSVEAELIARLTAGVGIAVDLDELFTDFQDAVAFSFAPLTARAELRARNINFGAKLGPLDAGVEDGTLDLVLQARLEIEDPNSDGGVTLREISEAGFTSLVDLTASASIDATLPLHVEVFDFELSEYGQPVVRITGDDFLTFDLNRSPKFVIERPDIAFDIRITAALRDALLGVLNTLDQKLDGLAGDLDSVLGFELPGLGISIGELFKINDILAAFNLKDIVEPYFDQFTFTGDDFPTLFGILEALNDGVARASQAGFDVLNAFNENANFAGFDFAGYFDANGLLKELRGFNFRGANLRGVDLSGFDLSGVDFSGADLRGAILSLTNLRGVDFSGADLRGALLDGALALGALFRDARLDINTDFAGLIFDRTTAWLDGIAGRFTIPDLGLPSLPDLKLLKPGLSLAGLGYDFSGWDLSGLDLSGVDLSGIKAIGANLRGAILKAAKLLDVDLTGALALDVDFSGVLGAPDLSGLYDTFAKLKAAINIGDIDLHGFDLSGLDLSGISFEGFDLRGVDLSGALNFDASGVLSLFGADLRGISFLGTDLSGIDLRFADLSGLNLSGFNLSGLKLKGVKLAGVDLSGVNFAKSLLQGVDLSGVKNLSAAKLKGAFFDALTKVAGGINLADFDAVAAEIPDDIYFTPFDGPVFAFTGGFDADTLKASIGVQFHLRQIFDFKFDFDASDLLGDFTPINLGPVHIDPETLLAGDFDVMVGMGVDFGAAFGVYLGELPSQGLGAAFLQLDEFQAGAGVKAAFDLSADLGILSGEVVGGTASLTAGVRGTLEDDAGESLLGEELRLNALSGASFGFEKDADLHVALPFDIAVGSFHLSSLGLTPTLRLDDDNLFMAPGP